MIAKRNNSDPASVLKRLWGDHFYDPESKKFYSVPKSPTGKLLTRYVCSQVLDPLIKVFTYAMSPKPEDKVALFALLEKVGVSIAND